MSRFTVLTFGCKLNQAEAESWIERLTERGYSYVRDWKEADVVLLNTCTLTVRADSDVRKTLRKIRREKPSALIVATGCLAEREPEQLTKEGVAAVFSNKEKDRVVEFVLRNFPPSGPFQRGRVSFRARYFLKVQEGCDYRCSYCIIPLVRGKSRSEPLEEILNRVKRALQEGFQEVVLTGIHLESYGRERGERDGFLKLLIKLEPFYPELRFRISSLDPRLLDRRLLQYIASAPHIMPHFHLSFQHVSQRILKLMRRWGSTQLYMDIIGVLKEARPLAGIGGDVIVGFPTESEQDFSLLLEFVRQAPLSYLHVFSFSPRPGTEAAKLRPAVPERIRKERSALLRRLVSEKNLAFRKALVGKELEVTVIGPGRGVTENYVKAELEGKFEPRKRYKIFISGVSEKGVVGVKPEEL